jgi:hypothetical protein
MHFEKSREMVSGPAISALALNPHVERSRTQRVRCLVPVALRAPAPAHLEGWAS